MISYLTYHAFGDHISSERVSVSVVDIRTNSVLPNVCAAVIQLPELW